MRRHVPSRHDEVRSRVGLQCKPGVWEQVLVIRHHVRQVTHLVFLKPLGNLVDKALHRPGNIGVDVLEQVINDCGVRSSIGFRVRPVTKDTLILDSLPALCNVVPQVAVFIKRSKRCLPQLTGY